VTTSSPTPADEARRIARAAAGGGPRKRTLVAFAVGSFLMVAPYALARATRTNPSTRALRDQPPAPT
jgi:hypothetical protein